VNIPRELYGITRVDNNLYLLLFHPLDESRVKRIACPDMGVADDGEGCILRPGKKGNKDKEDEECGHFTVHGHQSISTTEKKK
jgi:hypothetical protein